MVAYKLARKRNDGSYGPLFIGRKIRWNIGGTYRAQDIPTKGYAHRPGFHVTPKMHAPHLKQGEETDRVWLKVEVNDYTPYDRPESQGGVWYTANEMTILEKMTYEQD